MSNYYRKEDVDWMLSEMLAVAENEFFKEGQDPGKESQFLKGYTLALERVRIRFDDLNERKSIGIVNGN